MNEECSVIKLGEGGQDSRCSLNDSTNEGRNVSDAENVSDKRNSSDRRN